MRRILVTGAGGFIGHHLVNRLKAEGHWVRGVDIKYPEYEETLADEFYKEDLRDPHQCSRVTSNIDDVYQLAADMGGIGYITQHLAGVARNNVLINVNMPGSQPRQYGREIPVHVVSLCVSTVFTGAGRGDSIAGAPSLPCRS